MYNSLMGMGPKLATLSSQQLQHMGQEYKDDAIMLGLVLHEKQRRDAIQAAAHGQPNQQPPVNEQVVQSLGPQQQQQMPPPQQGQGPMPPQQGPQGPMPPQQGPQGPMPPQQGQGPMPPQRMADGGMTGLPEDSGIGALPAPNIARMAGGGIASFADAGAVKKDPKTAFIEQYKPYAAKAGQELGIDPALILSQWGLETAWGAKTVGDYNFGNIKDVTNKGPKALDKAENSRSAYKEYASPDAFVTDYTNLIKTNFPKAVGAGSDIGIFSSGLKSGRVGAYATDPDYGKKLATTAQTLGDVAPADQAEPGQIPGAMSTAQRKVEMDTRAAQEKEQGKTWGDFGSQGKRLIGLGEAGLSMLTGTGDSGFNVYAQHRRRASVARQHWGKVRTVQDTCGNAFSWNTR